MSVWSNPKNSGNHARDLKANSYVLQTMHVWGLCGWVPWILFLLAQLGGMNTGNVRFFAPLLLLVLLNGFSMVRPHRYGRSSSSLAVPRIRWVRTLSNVRRYIKLASRIPAQRFPINKQFLCPIAIRFMSLRTWLLSIGKAPSFVYTFNASQ